MEALNLQAKYPGGQLQGLERMGHIRRAAGERVPDPRVLALGGRWGVARPKSAAAACRMGVRARVRARNTAPRPAAQGRLSPVVAPARRPSCTAPGTRWPARSQSRVAAGWTTRSTSPGPPPAGGGCRPPAPGATQGSGQAAAGPRAWAELRTGGRGARAVLLSAAAPARRPAGRCCPPLQAAASAPGGMPCGRLAGLLMLPSTSAALYSGCPLQALLPTSRGDCSISIICGV
jgi:hypothetical protein